MNNIFILNELKGFFLFFVPKVFCKIEKWTKKMSNFDSARFFFDSKKGKKSIVTIMLLNPFFEKINCDQQKKMEKDARTGFPFFGSMVRLPKRGKKGDEF
jgi:hypothetical protein